MLFLCQVEKFTSISGFNTLCTPIIFFVSSQNKSLNFPLQKFGYLTTVLQIDVFRYDLRGEKLFVYFKIPFNLSQKNSPKISFLNCAFSCRVLVQVDTLIAGIKTLVYHIFASPYFTLKCLHCRIIWNKKHLQDGR